MDEPHKDPQRPAKLSSEPDPLPAGADSQTDDDALETVDHRRPGHDTQLGTTPVAGYQLLSELGRGGMGVVYRARQESLNREVAMKMVLAGDHSSAGAKQRFVREAEAAAKLQHPNIVRVYDFGESEGRPYMAMELIEGTDLQRTGQVAPKRAAEIMIALAKAIQYAHDQGIVHRDIKPANVLIDSHDIPKITDFGLAKVAADEHLELTAEDQLLGTAPYMPPEQARGDAKNVGPAADIYSLGAVLFHLLTGQAPFIGKSTYDVLKKVEHTDPTSPRRLADGIPVDLETICLKCLRKKPTDRYATAGKLADDLQRYLAGENIHASTIGPVTRAARYVRRKTGAQIALAVLACAVGVAAYRAWDYRQNVQPHVQNYLHIVNRFGVPVGHGAIPSPQGKTHFQVETRGRRGPVTSVTCMNSLNIPIGSTLLASFPVQDPDATVEAVAASVARVEFRRDTEGHVTEITAFDKHGRHLWSFDYSSTDPQDQLGHYVSPSGFERAHIGSKASYIHAIFDDDGVVTEVRFLDRYQNPQANNDGFYGYRIERNRQDESYLVTFLNRKYEPTLWKGVSCVRRQVDDYFRSVRDEFLDAEGNLTISSLGAAIIENNYEDDRLVSVVIKDVAGTLTNNAEGYARVEYSYDERGLVEERRYVDATGLPVLSNEGCAAVRFEYDAVGNTTKESCFDAQRKPAPSIGGYAVVDYDVDQLGRTTSMFYHDPDGNPATSQYAPMVFVHGMKMIYEGESNMPVETQLFGADGELLPGFAIAKVERNRNDMPTSLKSFNAAREPIAPFGFHEIRHAYNDDTGLVVRESWHDIEGNLSLSAGGYAVKKIEYDNQRNETANFYYGTDEQLVTTVWGYAIERRDYDDSGRVTERHYFDTHEQRTLNNNLVASFKYAYNELGQQIKVQAFDDDNQPTLGLPLKFASKVTSYDQQGNLEHERYFDENGEALNTADGYAEVVRIYDRFGRWCGERYADADGKTIPVYVVVSEVEPGSNAAKEKIKVNDIVTRCDDKAITDQVDLQYRLTYLRGPTVRLEVLRGEKRLTFEFPSGRIGFKTDTRFQLPDQKPALSRLKDFFNPPRNTLQEQNKNEKD